MHGGLDGKLRTWRILASALLIGPVMLWGISWVLTEGGSGGGIAGDSTLDSRIALLLWAAVALPAFASSLWARWKAVEWAERGASLVKV